MYLQIFLYYLVPFAIALAMPGWRSLSALLLVAGGTLVWMMVSVSQEMSEAGGGSGLGLAIAYALLMCIAAGLFSGIATRALLIRIRHSSQSVFTRISIGIVGFVLAPSLFAAWQWKTEWDNRLPSSACLASKHPVEIAGATYYLPAAPWFTVWTSAEDLYLFQFNSPLRRFCELSPRPIHAVNLSISQHAMVRDGPLREAFCLAPESRWGVILCDAKPASFAENYPDDISLYSPDEFDHRRMVVSGNGAYSGFLEERDRAVAGNLPLRPLRVGIFERYDRFWIARSGLWTNDAGEPFTLYCYDTPPAGTLYCRSTYRLKAGPQVTYGFRAQANKLEIVARAVDRNLQAMLTELSSE
jgi:uncharacterized membrane protein YeaQ/YmgE (transglycosylase-associated protein family)